MKSKLSNILTAIYLLLAGAAMFLIVAFPPSGDKAYLSTYGLAALWLITLPWSLVLFFFAWWLVHDEQNPVFLLFFALCVALNVYLLRRALGGAEKLR